VLLAVPPDNTISASPGGIRRAMVRGKRRAPWCGSPRRQWPARSEYRSPPELIPSIASASFGKPGLEHVPDLGPCPSPDRAKSRLEPSLASFTYRRVLQLRSQPAVGASRPPGQGGRCPRQRWPRSQPAGSPPQPAGHQGTGRSVVEPFNCGLRQCPRAASATGRKDPAEPANDPRQYAPEKRWFDLAAVGGGIRRCTGWPFKMAGSILEVSG
jgi:hypothetical protein